MGLGHALDVQHVQVDLAVDVITAAGELLKGRLADVVVALDGIRDLRPDLLLNDLLRNHLTDLDRIVPGAASGSQQGQS